jgi:hypothetical protein
VRTLNPVFLSFGNKYLTGKGRRWIRCERLKGLEEEIDDTVDQLFVEKKEGR